MAISCFSLLKPIIPQIMSTVIDQIVPEPPVDCISVCNNAAWATGEIALQSVGDNNVLEPFIGDLMNRLLPILLNAKSAKSLCENAAVTIGRLGLVAPGMLAPQLPTFAQAWCTALWEIKDNEEKDSAFRGFCMMVGANPAGLETVSGVLETSAMRADELIELCLVLQRHLQVAAPVCSPRHHVPTGMFYVTSIHPLGFADHRQILQSYKTGLGEGWEPTVSSFPPVIRQRLRDRYDV